MVQGTSTTDSIFELLPEFIKGSLPNVKLVAIPSYELFQRQTQAYRDSILSREDWLDSTVITNGSRHSVHHWLAHKTAERYTMSADWDDRWRTGGSGDEIRKEAHLDPASLKAGIQKFASERDERLAEISFSR